MTSSCCHCGEPVPRGFTATVAFADGEQPVCCYGCKAAVEFIRSSGLDAFYRHREAGGSALLRPEVAEWQRYDSDALRARYVSVRSDGVAEATLDVGGIYCSACVWLLNKVFDQDAAVVNVSVNPSTHRLVIAWQDNARPFSELLATIARLGFTPKPTVIGESGVVGAAEYRLALKRLLVAAVAGMQVMMFAVALYAGAFHGIEHGVERFLRLVSLLVATPVVLYSARPFFEGAWRGIRTREPGMDVPVALAVGAAYVASAVATFRGVGEVYFDSVVMFVLFLSAARFIEMRSRHRADDRAAALARMLPDTVVRLRDGARESCALDEVAAGDVLLIGPGDVIPVDGEILEGSLEIDESVLTGEFRPVLRGSGAAVFAGAINRCGSARVAVTRTGAATSLAEVGRLLERAQGDRPPVVLFADRVASAFVVAVLAIAASAGIVWWQLDPARAFEVMLATLVVTCPCALALATPAAIGAAASRLAGRGLLLVRARILQVFRPGVSIVFDKTGTLTRGRPALLETQLLDPQITREEALGIAAAIETASEHVLARAFSPFSGSAPGEASDVVVVAGAGIEARVGARRYRIGRSDFVGELGTGCNEEPAGDDVRTHVWLGSDDGVLARFAIGDELREDAAATVRWLRDHGFEPVVASGDRPASVAAVASSLGIARWHAGLTPAGKLELLKALRSGGETVVMVGDGINDSPMLAAADASVALDAGTALARASADGIVPGTRLGLLRELAETAERTRRVVRQNMVWAIGYNLAAVPLAVTGIIAPWMAAIGMSASSLIVVANSLRLQRAAADAGREPRRAVARAAPESAA